jgi:thiol-disulfide isomerase/thioredoxin
MRRIRRQNRLHFAEKRPMFRTIHDWHLWGRIAVPASLMLFAFAGGRTHDIGAEEKPLKADHRGVITGKIVDRVNSPVVGARATLYRWQSPTRRWGRWKVATDPVVTDKAGTYRFEGLADDYFMLSIECTGFARAFSEARIKDKQTRQLNLMLSPPASPVIRIEDHAGKPIVGARVREFRLRGVNGKLGFPQLSLATLGITILPSDKNGRLQLPPLPSGDVVCEVIIDHSGFAPVRVDELRVASGAEVRVTMQPGVAVTLRVPVDRPAERITGAIVDLRHEPFHNPSTCVQYEAQFDSQGTARLTVEPGNYSYFLLQHENFFITPVYAANLDQKLLRIEPGRNQDLHFDIHRKVSVRGRILESDTGKPLRNMSVMGELKHRALRGWDDPPPDEWSFAGWGESDEQGEYRIALAAGSARVSLNYGSEFLSEQEFYELTVTADGSSVIPDIQVRRLPKIVGIVQNPDGSAAVRAVVRLRGKSMTGQQPVLTNAAGRFELQPEFIPLDEKAQKRAFVQSLIAFDPFRPLAARAEVRLDKPEAVVLKLEPHDPDWPLSAFLTGLMDGERGVVSPDEAARYAAISLRDRPAPELEAALWLNTGGQPLRLADLRGKFVLLDFWFTGCGPCHGDFPSVKLVHELYKDKGVVVIGVHNNSSTPEAVREHVAKIKLPFPVALDYPDGRTIARFEPHGIPNGYPDYVLISPEGKVLLDDRTIPHATLRAYKLEIIRKFLLESRASAK